jgi:hypothetical protein
MVVRLDEEKNQHAGPAFDAHASLICIEVSDESIHVLPLAARRIRRQVRLSDSVLLLEKGCALLLPATPFSGAQAVASRIALLLTSISCELRVYHGATALLVAQRLHEAGARPVSRAECQEIVPPISQENERTRLLEPRGSVSSRLPYLAFLASYPPPQLLHLFPYELACRYQCVPVGAERRVLTLGTCRRLNCDVLTQLRAATSREIFQVLCEAATIDEVLRYWQQLQTADVPARAGTKTAEVCQHSR